ncbi:hypothetical protein ACGFJC_54110, partial [Nonomuraea fuscirosea]|uniref:hypothetical protein n=1 Tax=Nonomuraea fuscirosea TaxID=1291556 RepID=UPI00346EE6CA
PGPRMSVYLENSWPPAWIRLAAHLEKLLTVHTRSTPAIVPGAAEERYRDSVLTLKTLAT